MMTPDASETFPQMLRRVLGTRLAGGAADFIEMFAEDGVLEYPFAPAGLATPLIGRPAIIANFERIRKLLRVDTVSNVVVQECNDPEVVIIEFLAQGEGLIVKEPYNQRYVSVIRMRDGRIAEYKDYWNPLEVLRAIKGPASLNAAALD